MSENKLRIFDPLKNRFVKVNEYGIAAKKLYKIYIDDLNTPAENVLPPGLKYNQETGYFTKTKQQKQKEVSLKVEKITYSNSFNNNNLQSRIPSIIKQKLSKYKGKSVKIITFRDGIVFQEGIINIPNSFSSWWQKSDFFRSFVMIDSAQNIFSKTDNLLNAMADVGDNDYGVFKDKKNQGTMIIDRLKKVKGEQYAQSFLDGINHCFFTPIKSWAENCLDESKSKSAIKRYKTYIKKIDDYLIKYKEGLPEDKIQSVCDKLQIAIEVDLPSLYDRKVKLLIQE